MIKASEENEMETRSRGLQKRKKTGKREKKKKKEERLV